MTTRSTVKIHKNFDPKKLAEFRKRLEGISMVKVGIPSGSSTEDGTPLALVAAVHEFGSPEVNVPERPFLRNTIKGNQRKYVQLNKRNIIRVLEGRATLQQALGVLGEVAKGDVQTFIANNSYTLKPITIARKGSSRALVDTGNMRGSITWQLDDKP